MSKIVIERQKIDICFNQLWHEANKAVKRANERESEIYGFVIGLFQSIVQQSQSLAVAIKPLIEEAVNEGARAMETSSDIVYHDAETFEPLKETAINSILNKLNDE